MNSTDLTLFWLRGEGANLPSIVDFVYKSVRRNVMVMKLLEFLQLPIVHFLRKFHSKILTNEGKGDNSLGLTLEKSEFLESQLSRKKDQNYNILLIPFVVYCYLMYSIIIIVFGWKLCSKFNFIAIFQILANLPRSLTTKRKMLA